MSGSPDKPPSGSSASLEADDTRNDAVLPSAEEVADRAGVSVTTLKRWVKAGAIPQYNDAWTPAASAHARIVAQLRRSGQSLDEIVRAANDGRLALGAADDLFISESETYTLEEAAKRAGLSPALAEQMWVTLGFSLASRDKITENDVEALTRVARVLDAGIPLGAFLQVMRVAAKAFADVADAEARLVRMFVHEPMLRDGAGSEEISKVMGKMIEAVLPEMSPLLTFMHMRYLQQYAEQIQIENVQSDAMGAATGMINVAICFVDIVGFTRYTEQAGVQKAFEQAEQLRSHIETTLPDSARLIKLTGDGAMIIGSEPGELAGWAVDLAQEEDTIFNLRIGLDYGEALYRDGDYFGGAVNMSARVLNRADSDEVLATAQIKSQLRGRAPAGLRFVSIGRVRLKGFDEPVELFRVERRANA